MNNLLKAGIVAGALGAAVVAQGQISVSASAPTTDIVTSWTGGTQSMSIRNLADGTTDRSAGQSFTVTGAVDINRITFQMANNTTFVNDGGAQLWFAIYDTAGTGTQIGSTTTFDLNNFSTTKDSYLTFQFSTISLPAAGEYAVEMQWIEDGSDGTDDASLNLAFYRSTTGTYTGGGQISKADDGSAAFDSFPHTELNGSASNDFNFYVQAVPEPATFALLGGIAALGLVMYRRRR